MGAKEYYCKKWDVGEPNIIGWDQIEFAEEYHQAKSKEEAEERCRKAEIYFNGKEYNATTILEGLRIASGKKK